MVVAWRSVDPTVNIYIINDMLVAKGRAVQVGPTKPTWKMPGTRRSQP